MPEARRRRTMRPVAATAIVLAGGRSSRFGSDKLAADLDGVPLLHHAIRAVADVCAEVLVVGAPTGLSVELPDDIAAAVVLDADAYQGPLVALVDAASAATHRSLLIVAGDMPHLEPAVLERLLAGAHEHQGACLLADGRAAALPDGGRSRGTAGAGAGAGQGRRASPEDGVRAPRSRARPRGRLADARPRCADPPRHRPSGRPRHLIVDVTCIHLRHMPDVY